LRRLPAALRPELSHGRDRLSSLHSWFGSVSLHGALVSRPEDQLAELIVRPLGCQTSRQLTGGGGGGGGGKVLLGWRPEWSEAEISQDLWNFSIRPIFFYFFLRIRRLAYRVDGDALNRSSDVFPCSFVGAAGEAFLAFPSPALPWRAWFCWSGEAITLVMRSTLIQSKYFLVFRTVQYRRLLHFNFEWFAWFALF